MCGCMKQFFQDFYEIEDFLGSEIILYKNRLLGCFLGLLCVD